jgi:hypothetical protein
MERIFARARKLAGIGLGLYLLQAAVGLGYGIYLGLTHARPF